MWQNEYPLRMLRVCVVIEFSLKTLSRFTHLIKTVVSPDQASTPCIPQAMMNTKHFLLSVFIEK